MTGKHAQTGETRRLRQTGLQQSLAAGWNVLKKAPLSARGGILIILTYSFIAIFAPLIAPFREAQVIGSEYLGVWTPYYLEQNGELVIIENYNEDLNEKQLNEAIEAGHSIQHLVLGTDNLGRDMLTRLFFGARNTIGMAIATTMFAFLIGGGLGIIAAIRGGWIDIVASRLIDVLMAIPQLIFALLLLTFFGTSIPALICIIGLLDATRVFRLTRAVSMNVAVLDFVEAAKLQGEGLFWIARREILPNILPTLVAEFGLRFCSVFLLISALSFLGLGIQPPTADWGTMVRDNATLIAYGIPMPLIPAGAIALLTIAINFVVDWFLHLTSGLRDGR